MMAVVKNKEKEVELLNWFGDVVLGSGSHAMLGGKWDCDVWFEWIDGKDYEVVSVLAQLTVVIVRLVVKEPRAEAILEWLL
ncbi:hypothetical protein F0562_015796 [Nyssa sinensis]|uniref:Uncharacterized protein n=1 Tax=Nyssa sinensis TaxID=561372 RepID=A0A5J4ZML8_9ASTE|nr:hypothetical protein F0562_015796 [Nyssa sinensis]